MKKSIAFLFLIFLLQSNISNAQTTVVPKYIKVADGYLMVLKQGDSLFTELSNFFLKENIPSASFSGFGFATVEFGFFNSTTKVYKAKKFEDLELAALEGSIAWQKGKPSIHAHGIGGDKNFRCHAGHILRAVVGTGSLEITISIHDKKLERVKDEQLGANVLELVD